MLNSHRPLGISSHRTTSGRASVRHPRLSRLIPLFLFLALPSLLLAAGRLKVQFLDVGQGDATLITCPEGKHHMLIDSGDSRYPGAQAALKKALTKELGTNAKLDVAVASHPHSDHIGGMLWVLTHFTVGTYIDNGREYDSTGYRKIKDEVEDQSHSDEHLTYVDGRKNTLKRYQLCDQVAYVLITPMASAPKNQDDPNNESVGVRLEYQSKSFLFVGDMEDVAEESWLKDADAKKLLKADVLKVPHHGSDTSSSPAFIKEVSPVMAFIMCGEQGVSTNAGYKHPRYSTLENYHDWFKAHPLPSTVTAPASKTITGYDSATRQWRSTTVPGLWASVVDGTMTVETDGSTFTVTTTK